jgi:hypothetical protein
MSLDPIDGRDFRGRGRSRDTSISRQLGLSTISGETNPFLQTNAQYNQTSQ